MRRFATAAVIAGAALASSAGSANAFFHLLFQSEQQTQAQQYYRNDPSSNVQISPIPREVVAFSGYSPGTIVVSTSERRLYYVLGNGTAIRYGVGVGRPGFTWAGTKTVARKAEWPDWTPPAQMLKRRPDLPRHMVGGEANPLGARAMYLGGTLYRIHGSNEPDTIGTAVSSGCIRMTNADVIDLYNRVKVGTRVVVLR
ncbi:MAG TPA: L,D-transpeptidase [Beijerinckiaceae bacterium]|jgi:lipoprotein-anchoring transpeptidase ErfK/SrfK|nr:L,D-transpeptidase [Beijerinckiaceae bacterium]